MLTVLTGGARSGKSRAAAAAAMASGAPVSFIATAEAGDDEMVERIARHRSSRPAHWTTLEASNDLMGAVESVDPAHTIIIDCLAVWATNRMLRHDRLPKSGGRELRRADESSQEAYPSPPSGVAIEAEASELAAELAARPGQSIVVTNEVGSGIVPATPLGREFRDLLGLVNQTFVGAADTAFLVVAGRLLPLVDPGQAAVGAGGVLPLVDPGQGAESSGVS